MVEVEVVGVYHWFTPGITVLGGDVGGRSGGGVPLVHSGGSLSLVVMLEVEVVGVYHWFTPGITVLGGDVGGRSGGGAPLVHSGDHCPWW